MTWQWDNNDNVGGEGNTQKAHQAPYEGCSPVKLN